MPCVVWPCNSKYNDHHTDFWTSLPINIHRILSGTLSISFSFLFHILWSNKLTFNRLWFLIGIHFPTGWKYRLSYPLFTSQCQSDNLFRPKPPGHLLWKWHVTLPEFSNFNLQTHWVLVDTVPLCLTVNVHILSIMWSRWEWRWLEPYWNHLG